MEKILFLDIDGCMTAIEDGSSYLVGNPDTYRISENKFSILKTIIEKTGCKVVISSNWRRFKKESYWIYNEKSYSNQMPKLVEMLGESYAGDLPHDRYVTKCEALYLWFEDNDIDRKDIMYVIIDDDVGEGFCADPEFSKRFVLCDENTGLTFEQSEEIIKYFNKG